jgi:Ca2+ transporting ATPase
LSRRVAFQDAAAAFVTAFGILAAPPLVGSGAAHAATAAAAAGGPTKEDLERIKVGYRQITYLLDNFEKETTVCRENGGECKRDADPVRRALGLRTIDDPLFQIDKVFSKVKNMDLDPDQLEAFFEASESWNSALNMSNSMAFISQFGEYNPGGGKDEVLKYLNESKKQVVVARDSLKTIMDCLGIES